MYRITAVPPDLAVSHPGANAADQPCARQETCDGKAWTFCDMWTLAQRPGAA